MKIFLKNIVISFLIAFVSFYSIYLINKTVLYNDLYAQGLGFLGYFKDQLNIFNGDLVYNWNIGLGDSTYSMFIYYLISPFNLLLYLFKKVDMVDLLPILMTIKIAFIAYFSSLYFKEVLKPQYKWIATIIYVSNYNLIMYGSIHVMWLDTFAFLPLVLLGIEKILKKERSSTYILSLWLLIISNYYLAALMIPQIAIYGVIRYEFIHGKKHVLNFVGNMIMNSIVSLLLSSFVLIPAIGYMLGSAKDMNTINLMGINFKVGLDFINSNFIGTTYSTSSIHITIVGILTILPFYIFNKEKKYRLYLIHILILLVAVYSNLFNYIFNLGYEACGGDYRYNIILNIYIGILVCKVIDEVFVKRNKALFKAICISGIVFSLVVFKFMPKNMEINIVILLAYIIIFAGMFFIKNINKKVIVYSICSILLIELFFYSYYMTSIRDFKTENYAKSIKQIVSYVGDKYGKDKRIEINDNGGVYNTYLSQGVLGVEGFHSLMKSEYRSIGDVFTDTAYMKVINRLGGRNIITRFTGERYYASPYNYCPYVGSKLIETAHGYYIFDVPNVDIKYFNEESVVHSLPDSMIEKDALLYDNLYLDKPKSKELNSKKAINLREVDIKNNNIEISNDGEYYLSINTAPENEYTMLNISIELNGIKIGDKSHFSKMIDYNKKHSEIYIGYLKKGDKLKVNFDLGNNPRLVFIDKETLIRSIESMNSISNQHLTRSKNELITRFTMNNSGYAVLPVIYSKEWNIKVNGKSLEPYVVNGGFTAFHLNKGTYTIDMTYKPYSIYIGMGVTLITSMIILVIRIKSSK